VLARLHWPGSAEHLALVRIALGAFLTSAFLSPAIPYLLEIPGSIFPETRSIVPFALEAFFAEHMWHVLHVGLIGSVLMTLGLFTRVALPVLFCAYFVSQNFYYRALTAHDDWLYFIFPLLVLCFARPSDVWSLDAWIAKKRGKPSCVASDLRAYRWPVELLATWVALVYFAAGLSKLFPLRKGIVWLSGSSAQRMAMYYLRESPAFFVFERSLFDYGLQWPFALLGAGAVLIELSAITLLFTRRLTPFVLAGIVSMHIGIYWMGIAGFTTLALVSSVALIDPRAVRRLSERFEKNR
jgi:hypothetical protein